MPNELQEQALPNEVWAKVFSTLAAASEDDVAAAIYIEDYYHFYQQIHKLRLVCKQFQAILTERPELCSLLLGQKKKERKERKKRKEKSTP